MNTLPAILKIKIIANVIVCSKIAIAELRASKQRVLQRYSACTNVALFRYITHYQHGYMRNVDIVAENASAWKGTKYSL